MATIDSLWNDVITATESTYNFAIVEYELACEAMGVMVLAYNFPGKFPAPKGIEFDSDGWEIV